MASLNAGRDNPTSTVNPVQPHSPRFAFVITCALVVGCGGDAPPAQAAAMPERSGDVWELDDAASRASAPAALLAFVNGVHVMVVDGDDVYAGTQKLDAAKTNDGARALPIAADPGAQLIQDGDALSVRFAGGETVRLRRQPPRPEVKK